MALTARELLAEIASAGEDLETVARRLLPELAEPSRLSSTYLAATRVDPGVQDIV